MQVTAESVTLRAPRDLEFQAAQLGKVSPSRHVAPFALILAVATMMFFGGALLHPDVPISRAVFASLLLGLCLSTPWFATLPKRRLLVFFSLWYFLSFGFSDALATLLGADESTLNFLRAYASLGEFITRPDLVIIAGIVCTMSGYLSVQNIFPGNPTVFSREWRYPAVLAVALMCWLPGTVISIEYYLTVTPGNIPSHLLGVPLNIASNMRVLPVLAGVMAIYLILKGYRRRLLWSILAAMILVEFVFGFIANTKELSFRLPMLLILGGFIVHGRISKKLIVTMLVIFIPYHALFSTYRIEIMQVRSNTPGEALQDYAKTQEILAHEFGNQDNVISRNLRELRDRLNARYYVDIIVTRTGKDVSYQNGATLLNLVYTFIPRAMWPEKPDTSTGQLFNHEFGLSESRLTFVPTTHLGEFYWNYGWSAVFLGMLAIGLVLGAIGRLQHSSTSLTLPRFVIILITVYFLIVKFESSVGQQYGLFARVFVIMAVLHGFVRVFGLTHNSTIINREAGG